MNSPADPVPIRDFSGFGAAQERLRDDKDFLGAGLTTGNKTQHIYEVPEAECNTQLSREMEQFCEESSWESSSVRSEELQSNSDLLSGKTKNEKQGQSDSSRSNGGSIDSDKLSQCSWEDLEEIVFKDELDVALAQRYQMERDGFQMTNSE